MVGVVERESLCLPRYASADLLPRHESYEGCGRHAFRRRPATEMHTSTQAAILLAHPEEKIGFVDQGESGLRVWSARLAGHPAQPTSAVVRRPTAASPRAGLTVPAHAASSRRVTWT